MDHLLELGAGMSRFADLAAKATGDEPVPGCPDWTTRDLTHHLGSIHRWAAAIVLSGQRLDMPSPTFGDSLVEWYAGTATALLAALQAVDVDEPVPNFSRINETAGFFHRRQMHEVSVHVVDAAQALGLPEAEWQVESALAADGVEEVLHIFFPRMTARGQVPDVRSRVRLTATDTGQSWIIAPPGGEGLPPVLVHSSLDAESHVEGTASDLYLALWHRVPSERLTFDNDDGRALFAGPTTP
ncbi:maleylpyruvate isomerase family mycothiol-dependent enzyme [Aeromicrobium panaciterrae]|uniref:maleylpyruvate isomerase family mycothiol-dependent enzyme n=1 Tax=Aeromicrobium panaciterrae TaxID=363861 RepID=UPI0031D876C9